VWKIRPAKTKCQQQTICEELVLQLGQVAKSTFDTILYWLPTAAKRLSVRHDNEYGIRLSLLYIFVYYIACLGSIQRTGVVINCWVIMWYCVSNEKELGSIDEAHETMVWSLSWHPLGHILVSGSNDHTTWAVLVKYASCFTCLENLEMSGNLTAVREMSRNCQGKILSGKMYPRMWMVYNIIVSCVPLYFYLFCYFLYT